MRPIDDLAAEICTLAGKLNAANYRWLQLIAEFDQREGWSDGATQSCAHWLSWKCGVAMGAAREKVRVAHALENLPKISAAMACGKLSYSKVREIARVASDATEDYLLMIAEHGTAQHVEKLVRAYRRCQEVEELSREARQQQTRGINFRYDDDGSLIINGRLPAEAGAKLMKALEVALQELPKNVPAGTSEEPVRFSARRADALTMIAESFLAHGAMDVRGADSHQIVVHVSAETLQSRKAGCCEFEHGPSLAAETARRFACDASIIALIEDEDGEPLNVGRKTRTISAPLRRALNARDKGCRFPGCANTRYIDAHHVEHWANGGETKPSNLVSLCRFHHHAVHEGGIRVQILDDGAFRFVKRDGVAVDSILPGFTQPLGDWTQLPAAAEKLSRWSGDRMNLGLAVDILVQKSSKSKNVPAGTSICEAGAAVRAAAAAGPGTPTP